MLIKLNPFLQVFARRKEERAERPLSRKEWINVDRVVMVVILVAVIIGAIIFS